MATVLTNTGKAKMIGALYGDVTTAPTYIGWGTGAGTAAATDTTLFTEAAEARVNGTKAKATTNVANDTYRVTGTMTAAAGKTITNVGLFDASTTGNLYVKGDFTGQALNTGDSIAFTIDIVQT